MTMIAKPDRSTRARPLAAAALTAAGVLLGGTAQAGLGEPVASVARDHAALRGTALTVSPAGSFDVHETTLEDGTRVRQYAAPGGTVFAVAWTGTSLPNLQVLLGQHYGEYLAAAAAHRGSHHLLSVATPGLVLTVTKLARASSGSAHVPALLPANTSVQDLR